MFAIIHNADFLQYTLERSVNKEARPSLEHLELKRYLLEEDINTLEDVFTWCNFNTFNQSNERSLAIGDIIAKKGLSDQEWYYFVVEPVGFKLLFISDHPNRFIKEKKS